jgi:hypothetical protein
VQAFTIYFYGRIPIHDCRDHLPRASDTPTVHSVNLSESHRIYVRL